MNRTPSEWTSAIAKLKPGLTIAEASRQLGIGYGYTHRLCKGRYKFVRQPRRTDHSKDKLKVNLIDWSMNNSAIARKHGVSREWVRQARLKAGKAKVSWRVKA